MEVNCWDKKKEEEYSMDNVFRINILCILQRLLNICHNSKSRDKEELEEWLGDSIDGNYQVITLFSLW